MENWWIACVSEEWDETETRKGPWTSEEDTVLVKYIRLHGEGRWNFLAKASGLKRTGKSCRLRWINYLRPDLKRSKISPEEERLINELHGRWGNRWSRIAKRLPGRTDNEIKNFWRTRIKKKIDPQAESRHRTGVHGENRSVQFERSKGSHILGNSAEILSDLHSPERCSNFPRQNTEEIEVETNVKTPYLQDNISSLVIPIREGNYECELQREIIHGPSQINDDGKPSVTLQEHLEGLLKQNSLPFNFSVRSLATLISPESFADEATQDNKIPTSFSCTTVASPEEFSDNETYIDYSDVLWNMDEEDDRFNRSRPSESL